MSALTGPYSASVRTARGTGWSLWDGTHRSTGQPVTIRQLTGAAGDLERLRSALAHWPAHPAIVAPEALIRHGDDLLVVYPAGTRGQLNAAAGLSAAELERLRDALDAVLAESVSGGWNVGDWPAALISRRETIWQVAGLAEARAGLVRSGGLRSDVDGACALLRRAAAEIAVAAAMCVSIRHRYAEGPASAPAEAPDLELPSESRRRGRPLSRRSIQLMAAAGAIAVLAVVTLRYGTPPGGPQPIGVTAGALAADSAAVAPPVIDRNTAGPQAAEQPTAETAHPPDPVNASDPAQWGAYLAELYRLRGEAVRLRDVALLDEVYTPDSAQRQRDANLIAALVATGRHADGFSPQLLFVDAVQPAGSIIELVVRDRLAAFTLVDEDGEESAMAGRGDAAVTITMRIVDGRWLIDTVAIEP